MPLPETGPREALHLRRIEMRGYARPDGLYDLDGRLYDAKPVPFQLFARDDTLPPHAPLHDIGVRLTFDLDFNVRDAIAVSDATPYPICPEAAASVAKVIGLRIAAGWRMEILRRLGRTEACAHIVELLVTMGAAALQSLTLPRRPLGEAVNADGLPRRVDSCYAFERGRGVIARVWPELARPAPPEE